MTDILRVPSAQLAAAAEELAFSALEIAKLLAETDGRGFVCYPDTSFLPIR